jgi:hypothetical protein
MQLWTDFIVDKYGNALKGVTVTALDAAGALATLFDVAGSAQANPMSTDEFGRFVFRAASGEYTLKPSGQGVTAQDIVVTLDDPDEHWRVADIVSDYVVSGCLAATAGGLNGTTSTGVAYVGGARIALAQTTSVYTASKDTYLDLNAAGALVLNAVANGGGEPALAANTIRLAKVVTDATQITAVTDRRPLDVFLKSARGVGVFGSVAVVKELKATASLDFPSIAAQGQQELTIALTGALAGAPVVVGVNVAPPAGIALMGYCVLNDVITVRALNVTAGAIDPASLSVTVGTRVLA